MRACVLQGNVESSSSICLSPVSPVLHNVETTIVVKEKKIVHLQWLQFLLVSTLCNVAKPAVQKGQDKGAILYLICFDTMPFKMSH